MSAGRDRIAGLVETTRDSYIVRRGVGRFVHRASLGRSAVDLSRASAKYLFCQGQEFSDSGIRQAVPSGVPAGTGTRKSNRSRHLTGTSMSGFCSRISGQANA